MTPSRKKPGVAFWATVVVVAVLVAYPLSFGPACWISSRTPTGRKAVNAIYQPFMRLWWRGAEPARRDPLVWYARVGADRNKSWTIGRDRRTGEYWWRAVGLGGWWVDPDYN